MFKRAATYLLLLCTIHSLHAADQKINVAKMYEFLSVYAQCVRIAQYASTLVPSLQKKEQDRDLKQLASDEASQKTSGRQLELFLEIKRLETLDTPNISKERSAKIKNLIATYAVEQHEYMRKRFSALGNGGHNPGNIVAQFVGLPWNTISFVNIFPEKTLRGYHFMNLSNDGILGNQVFPQIPEYGDFQLTGLPNSRTSYNLVKDQEIPYIEFSTGDEQAAFVIAHNTTCVGVCARTSHSKLQQIFSVSKDLSDYYPDWGYGKVTYGANHWYIDQNRKKLICCYVSKNAYDFLNSARAVDFCMRVTDINTKKTQRTRLVETLSRFTTVKTPEKSFRILTPIPAVDVCGTSMIKVELPHKQQPRLTVTEYTDNTDCGHVMTLDNLQELACADDSVISRIRTSPDGHYLLISNLKNTDGKPVSVLVRREQACPPPSLSYVQDELLHDLWQAHGIAVENNQVVYLKKDTLEPYEDQSKILQSCSQAFKSKNWLPRTMRTRLRYVNSVKTKST
jgi:hypothetical protein